MKTLEKKVHFKAEGTSIGCYDSKGNPMDYILVSGAPHITLQSYPDRLLNIDVGVCHTLSGFKSYHNYDSGIFTHASLRAVVNLSFVTNNNGIYLHAWRACSNAELASYYLAKYKACKNAIKMEVKNG